MLSCNLITLKLNLYGFKLNALVPGKALQISCHDSDWHTSEALAEDVFMGPTLLVRY